VLASQLPHQQVVLVTPRLAAHAFLAFDLLKGTLNERPPGVSSVGGGSTIQISHPISHRTPEYRMGMSRCVWKFRRFSIVTYG
jgi:hypothetical protein